MEDLLNRIYLSFIFQERWKFFAEGLGITLLLTVASFIIGSLLGAAFCALKTSRHGIVRKVTNAFISFLVQLPTLVLLMLFVYIVFGETSLSVTVVVMFGLTLKAGAYISDIFYTAVTAVNSGEVEAAHTLGLSRVQVFRYITLPQAISTALPVYKNQFVITLQETSVVGYLAVMDLTRASEVVTSRTYDALFGLIFVSVLYLLVGYLGNMLLNLLGKKKHLGGE
jgi:His/Glu/Gln/Arg/opine family amino acid ABC transporter permease subunit